MTQVRKRSRLVVLALGLALLAGCETPMPAAKLPDITFAHLPPLPLAVQRVETASRFTPTLRAPNVEHAFPAPPARAMEQWARQRLKAAGGNAQARFTILDASVTETKLPRDTSMRGTFTKQQSERYDAKAEAVVEIVEATGRRGTASASVARWTTIGEDVSLNERDRVKFDLIDGLMKDFDAELEKNIRQHLVNWLR